MISTVGEECKAFIPDPLPPDPPIVLTELDYDLLERANRSLGRLDGIAALIPDPTLFLYFYVRKEAILSSQIEGTQSSLSDLLLFENEAGYIGSMDEIREVSNYVIAMNYGMKRLRVDNFPLSTRLIKEIHGKLLAKGRGSEKTPGEYRRSQNWIGGSRPGNALFVPPPPHAVAECMGNLEQFLHDTHGRTPTLIKAALAHVQFETIHPFLDGNGRLGRLLITLLLCAENALQEPMLYLSLFFKQNRTKYYQSLQDVRITGDWNGWLRFFLEGVEKTARQAVETARRILDLFAADRTKIASLGRRSISCLRVHEILQRHPIITIPALVKLSSLSGPTVSSALNIMTSLEMIAETSSKKRNRTFYYKPYLSILDEGTVPLSD